MLNKLKSYLVAGPTFTLLAFEAKKLATINK